MIQVIADFLVLQFFKPHVGGDEKRNFLFSRSKANPGDHLALFA
jgi:hypothetical protein